MNQPLVSIIIPSYNSQEHIITTLKMLTAALSTFQNYEILVVCDNENDLTIPEVELYSKYKDQMVRVVISHTTGKAKAVKYGLENCRAPVVGWTDADMGLQSSKEEFVEMIKMVSPGLADCVIADRSEVPWSFFRRAKTELFHWFALLFFGLHLDTQGAIKLLTKEASEEVLKRVNFIGWEFDVEFLWWLNRLGYKISPYKVHWRVDNSGTEKPLDTLLLGIVTGPSMVINLIILRIKIFIESGKKNVGNGKNGNIKNIN